MPIPVSGSFRILISAAEASADAHGAELLKEIRKVVPPEVSVEAFGVGGDKLKAAGLVQIVEARELLSMGFVEVLGRLPRIFHALKVLHQRAVAERPDLAVLIDYPDFHFRLAKKLKREGIPLVYYIPPKIWAWRKRRVNTLRRLFDRVLCILPFEEEFYRSENVPVKYVGNPLIDELPLGMNRDEARSALGIAKTDRVLVLMPGSRPSELRYHLDLMLSATSRAIPGLRAGGVLLESAKLEVLIPLPATLNAEQVEEKTRRWRDENASSIRLKIVRGQAAESLLAADAALVKSGTSTLEAGLLACPHTVIFKTHWLTEWIVKNIIRYRGPVALVNLVYGGLPVIQHGSVPWSPVRDYLTREIICEAVTEDALTREVVSLFSDSQRREKMAAGFARLKEIVLGKQGEMLPSRGAALEILNLMMRKGRA